MKSILKKVLAQAGFMLVRTRGRYVQDGLVTMHNDHFRRDPAFRAAYNRGLQASHGVDAAHEWRVHIALWVATAALRVAGDFVEREVNAGFISSAILHHLRWNTENRRFYLIDTFRGPVLEQYSPEEIDKGCVKLARDALAAGAYVTEISRIRENYA